MWLYVAPQIIIRTMQTRRLKAIEQVADIISQHYEQGNQRKCYKQVWRMFVFPQMGLSYPTFVRYVKALKCK